MVVSTNPGVLLKGFRTRLEGVWGADIVQCRFRADLYGSSYRLGVLFVGVLIVREPYYSGLY